MHLNSRGPGREVVFYYTVHVLRYGTVVVVTYGTGNNVVDALLCVLYRYSTHIGCEDGKEAVNRPDRGAARRSNPFCSTVRYSVRYSAPVVQCTARHHATALRLHSFLLSRVLSSALLLCCPSRVRTTPLPLCPPPLAAASDPASDMLRFPPPTRPTQPSRCELWRVGR